MSQPRLVIESVVRMCGLMCIRSSTQSNVCFYDAGVTLNFYPPLRNEPVLFSTLKNEPKPLNNDPFH